MTEFADEDDDNFSSLNGGSASLHLPNPNADKASRGRPLEGLLMSKNRKLQDGMTKLRVAQDELSTSLQVTKNELEEITARYEEQKVLNDRLENDLLRVNGSGQASNANGTSTPKSRAAALFTADDASDPLSALNIGKKAKVSRASLPLESFIERSLQDTPAASAPATSAETSILPIITSQRDRFRQRNAELEEQLLRQSDTISELRNEIKTLQADNLKLYEKVRYLESYNSNISAGPSSLRSLVGNNKRDEELGKYKSLYEDHMNPFEVFKGKVCTRSFAWLATQQLTADAGAISGGGPA